MSATPSLKSVSSCTGVGLPPASALPTASSTGVPLPPPSEGLSVYHVAIGRGIQNYTCPSTTNMTATPKALGAVATLYNVSCQAAISTSSLSTLPDLVAMTPKDQMGKTLFAATPDAQMSGHHYFTDNTTPTFNLNVDDEKSLGVIFSKKVSQVPAPSGSGQSIDGSKAVPWLYLKTSDSPAGDDPTGNFGGVKEVYRVNTAGGAAPPTCEGLMGQSFSKEYSAEYWFFA
ncbi:hypothetical protein ACLMJK_002323 [Lecanora helva]